MTGTDAHLFFFGELRELLAPDNRARGGIVYPTARRASIKDAIEALGPPHTEVGSILVNGREAGFGHLLAPGDRAEIRPVPRPCDPLLPHPPLRPDPLPRLAFAVDANVGKLAVLLRLLGFDAVCDRTWSDGELAEAAVSQGRALLSRDRALLKRKAVQHGRLVRAQEPRVQLREVLDFFGLGPPFRAFTRCLRCNTPLEPVAKERILHLLEPLTRRYFNEFHTCPDCGRIYWPGSHHDRMTEDFLAGPGAY